MKTINIRNGFTMIELIFVIVILGLLAAVAIPKLSATRTDAEISKMATNLNTIISDIGSRYTAIGELDTWSDATNTPTYTDATTITPKDTKVTVPVYFYNGDKQCIKFSATLDGNLSVENGTDVSDEVCAAIQKMKQSSFIIHSFGGKRVSY